MLNPSVKPSPCGFCAGVAREEHAEAAVLQDERKRVVDVVSRMREKRKRRTDERLREAIIGSRNGTGARIDDRRTLRFCDLQRVVVGEAGIVLPAVAKFGCRK